MTDALKRLGSQAVVASNTPVGTVIMYAGPVEDQASPPGPERVRLRKSGWLVCDGSPLPIPGAQGSRSVYWPLYQVIGTTYGSDGENFLLPDYRGYFFRGRDFDNGHKPYTPRDPDRSTRTPSSPGLAPTAVGSTQDTVVQTHGHDDYQYLTTEALPLTLAPAGEGPLTLGTKTNCATDYGYPAAWVDKTFSETRPINISINLLIKFTLHVGHPDPSLAHLLGIPSSPGSFLDFAFSHRPPRRRRD